MDYSATLRVALRALVRNKLRSTLTMLGIVIGVAAVICVVAIGEGGSAQVQEQLHNLGDNLVWIEAGTRTRLGTRSGNWGTKSLTLGDAEAIRQQIPLIKLVSPHVDGSVQVVYKDQNWNTHYRGVSPEYLEIRSYPVAQGVPFSNEDVARVADVCLVGPTVVANLFGNENPIGKTIRVANLPCDVIGVLQAKGLSPFGYDQDDVILMPYTTVQQKVAGIPWLKDIMCSAVSDQVVHQAGEEITQLLRERHKLRPDEDNDFNIRSPEDTVKARESSRSTFNTLLAVIASVSLVVGGIGIMNIMLVSVTERTREIGVRMAVGATEQDVQLQFLSEAVVMCLFGGVIGLFAGIAAAALVGRALQWPTLVPLSSVLIALTFSAMVGIFFGFYPARKAALLDPIEALRFE